MESLTPLNFIHGFTNLISYFFGLFMELSFLVVPGSILQLTRFGLLARIIFFFFLIGSILMTLFPFESLIHSQERGNSVREYLYGIFEAQLIDSIVPPVIPDEFEKNKTSLNLSKKKSELRIFVDKKPLSNLKTGPHRGFKINEMDTKTCKTTDSVRDSECGENESNKMDLDICENFELRRSDATVKPSGNSDADMISLNASASSVRSSKSRDTKENAFIGRIESTELENTSVSISSTVTLKASSINIDEDNAASINELIRENSDETEEIMAVIDPDSSLDNYQDQESVDGISEDLEILLSVVETSQNSFRCSDIK